MHLQNLGAFCTIYMLSQGPVQELARVFQSPTVLCNKDFTPPQYPKGNQILYVKQGVPHDAEYLMKLYSGLG